MPQRKVIFISDSPKGELPLGESPSWKLHFSRYKVKWKLNP